MFLLLSKHWIRQIFHADALNTSNFTESNFSSFFLYQSLREDVNRQTDREKSLQKKYSDLMYERDILASQIQSAEAERRK